MFIKHNRVIGEAISILKNTNEAYASSNQNLDKVKNGSFLRIAGDSCFYVVRERSSFNYTNKFIVNSCSTIIVPEKVIPKLQEADKITLSFREQELDIVLGILSAGAGYSHGDVLTLEEGAPSLDIKTGQFNKMQLTVNGVKEGGAVSRIGVKSRGRYIQIPNPPFKLTGGTGKGVEFDFNFKPIDNPTILEKVIANIETKENESIIILTSLLPTNLMEGCISANKWLLTLNTPCTHDKLSERYSISSDFTPVLQFPLMSAGSFTLDIAYNHAMMKLEEEILDLRRLVQDIKDRRA